MKRSEFWKACFDTLGGGSHGERGANHLTAKADAAGTPWDPEEEPLPARLVVDQFGDLRTDRSRVLTVREKREAVRRWNTLPKLRERVEPIALSSCPSQGLAKAILAILDGKEGDSNG